MEQKAETAANKKAVDDSKKAAEEDKQWQKGSKSNAKKYALIHSPPWGPPWTDPVDDARVTVTDDDIEKTLRPKRPKPHGKKPTAMPNSPPKKPRNRPSLKAAAANKPRRNPLRRAVWTSHNWTTMLLRVVGPAI